MNKKSSSNSGGLARYIADLRKELFGYVHSEIGRAELRNQGQINLGGRGPIPQVAPLASEEIRASATAAASKAVTAQKREAMRAAQIKEATPVELNNARNLLRLSGDTDDKQLAQSVMLGTATRADHEKVRRRLGIKHTGVGSLRRGRAQIGRVIGTAVQFGQAVEMIERGGLAGEVGTLKLVKLGGDTIEKLSKSRVFTKTIEKFGDKFLGGALAGRRAAYALRGMIGVAGQLGGAAFMGWQIGSAIGHAHYAAEQAQQLSIGNAFDLARQGGLEQFRATEQERRIRYSEKSKQGPIGAFLQFTGLDAGGFEEGVKSRTAEVANQYQRARGIAGELGINQAQAEVEYARELGKPAEYLTDLEKNEALNQKIDEVIDPRQLENSLQAESYRKVNRSLLHSLVGDTFTTAAGVQRERRAAAEEVMKARLHSAEVIARQRKEKDEAVERALSPADRFRRDEIMAQTEARWGMTRSRHRAWAND